MPRPSDGPAVPRISAPDLPRDLERVAGLSPRADVFQARITGLSDRVEAPHARLAECVVAEASVDRFDLTGATLVNVEVDQLRAVELVAKSGRWRHVRVTGGRIGTLDLSDADLESVELRGVRVDYLALGRARAEDVLIVECAITTVDVPLATLSRVRFEDCRADEVDTRGLRAEHLDLRGLESLAYTDAAALRGATLSPRQAELHTPAFAAALGIRVV